MSNQMRLYYRRHSQALKRRQAETACEFTGLLLDRAFKGKF